MTVHIIATGGTISSHNDGTQWTNLTGATLVDELGGLPVDVIVDDFTTGPSSSLTTEDMASIAQRVDAALSAGADGVVVTHGTDTVELTAFVTQLLLGTDASRRPVVFTGSMRAHSHPCPDGPLNLRHAISVAAHPDACGRDVIVCLDGKLHAADRVRKHSAVSLDAFHSEPFEPLGSVTETEVRFTRVSPRRSPARSLTTTVPLVTCYPGMPADVVDSAARGAAGIVVEGFGDLNLPEPIWRPLLAASENGTLIVVASSVFTSNVGDAALRGLGIVGAGGLSSQKARCAAMAAISSTSNRDEAIAFLAQYVLEYDAADRSTRA